MREFVWQESAESAPAPASAQEARTRLEQGNRGFAAAGQEDRRHVVAVGREAFGLPGEPGGGLPQEPFAALLGCADARVPAELVFGQGAGSLFVARVAGNMLGAEIVGSLHFAAGNLPTVRLAVVLGHTGCGAVTAAVDGFLDPAGYLAVVHDPELRAVVDPLLAGVRLGELALARLHGAAAAEAAGYREALIDVGTVANAAISAHALAADVDLEVALGLYDLDSRLVGLPTASGWRAGLVDAPTDGEGIEALVDAAARAVPLG
ncbi:MAG: carbonic anhydrase [Egibacteraceae bacterium]